MLSSCELNSEQTAALVELIEAIPDILKSLDNPAHDEIFGYRINTDDNEHVKVPIRDEILNKFLAATQYNVTEAKEKVKNTLNWRNRFQPLHAAFSEKHDERLHLLGVITEIDKPPKPNMRVATWNLYANLKDPKALFDDFAHESNTLVNSTGDTEGTEKKPTQTNGDEVAREQGAKPAEEAQSEVAEASSPKTEVVLEGSPFLRWRIGLMEKSVQLLDFTDPQNNKIAQIHDYNNVSMWRMDPGMKRATKEIIQVFGDNYPELLSSKFFVNVATLMLWVFAFFSRVGVIGEETRRKFVILNNGNVAEYFGAAALPPAYNGGALTAVKLIESIDVLPRLSYPEYVIAMGLAPVTS